MHKTDNFPAIANELIDVAERVVNGELGTKKARAETRVLNERAARALERSLAHVTEPALRERLESAIARMKARSR